MLPSATHSEIKQAYRRLVRQHHPDVNGGDPRAAERFQRIQQAYDLLINEKPPPLKSPSAKRQARAAWPGRRVPLRTPVSGQDVTGTLRVTLEELFTGTTADISFEDIEPCERCGATGAEPGSAWIPCPPCQGMPSPRCEWCAGSGQVPSEACTACDGAGIEDTERTVRVAVPRSAKDGQVLRVKGKGGWGMRGRGAIRVDLHMENHPTINRSGSDLELRLPVGVLQAILGGEAEVQGLDEEPYRIAITPGSSSGKRFRLKNRGMYKSKNGDDRGDLFAVVEVQVPSHLTERQRQLYEMLLAEEASQD